MIPDPVFPALPLIPDRGWDRMTEDEKFARHCLEIAEAAKIFNARMAAGIDQFEAAKDLPVPRMNRPSQGAPSLQELIATHKSYDLIPFAAWKEHDRAVTQWRIDRITAMGLRPSPAEMKRKRKEAKHKRKKSEHRNLVA
jgi:hypothetical protein